MSVDRAQQAADAIDSVAALTPRQARSVLNEYTKDDLIAAIATGHGGKGGNGGSQPITHTVVGIDHTDIDINTGLADIYEVQEDETILAFWLIVTETFDGTDSGASEFISAACYTAGGSAAGGSDIGDSFAANETNAANAVGGLMFPFPADASTVLKDIPLRTPVPGGGAVQLVVDFPNGSGTNVPLDSIGTQGHMDVHLLLAVTP